MKESGFKYAELPGGKLLKFPESATDKEIQRAVRRELGLGNEDFLAAMEGFSVKVDGLIDTSRIQTDKNKEIVELIADALQANANRMAGEICDSIRQMRETMTEFQTALHRATQSQANLVIKLNVAVDALNKTLDAALGQSLAAMDEGHATTSRSASNMERSIAALGSLVTRLAQTADEMAAGRKVKRRAVRERDGSWTMESL